jgi:hypothetical protein
MIDEVSGRTLRMRNKAFLGNEIYWTANTISIYLAAAADQTKREIAEDMDFGPYPIGPVGKPTELANVMPLLAMTYTKYPQACKALMAFMMEADQSISLTSINRTGAAHMPQRFQSSADVRDDVNDRRSNGRCRRD